jgi:hypothetical protein
VTLPRHLSHYSHDINSTAGIRRHIGIQKIWRRICGNKVSQEAIIWLVVQERALLSAARPIADQFTKKARVRPSY